MANIPLKNTSVGDRNRHGMWAIYLSSMVAQRKKVVKAYNFNCHILYLRLHIFTCVKKLYLKFYVGLFS